MGPRAVRVLEPVVFSLCLALVVLAVEVAALLPMGGAWLRALPRNVPSLAVEYALSFGALGLAGGALALLAGDLGGERRRTGLRLVVLGLLSLPVLAAPFVMRVTLRDFAGSAKGALVLGGAAVLAAGLLAGIVRWGSPRVHGITLILAGAALGAWAGASACLGQLVPSALQTAGGVGWILGAAAVGSAAGGGLGALLGTAPVPVALRRLAIGLPVCAGLLALLTWGSALAREPAAPLAELRAQGPSVLLVVVDTLRADRVSALGGAPGLTPNVDRLAADAVTFERTHSTAPWTTPSFGSLFTSRYPYRHGAGVVTASGLRGSMDPELIAFPQVLQRAGYWTGAVLSNPSARAAYGFDRGFVRFDNLLAAFAYHPVSNLLNELLRVHGPLPRKPQYIPAPQQTRRVLEMLREGRATGRPFLLLAHYMDPHLPHLAPPAFLRGDEEDLAASYDAEVRFFDRHFGRLLDALQKMGLYDDLLIVFTADHGEELLEGRADVREHAHGHTLFEELLRVPLIVKLPGNDRAGERSAEPASLLDVAPTILARAGLQPPPDLAGHDLLRSPSSPSRILFAEALLSGDEQKAALQGSLKLVVKDLPPRLAAGTGYDLRADPGERHPLAPLQREEDFRRLADALAAHTAADGAAPPASGEAVEVAPGLQNQLKALGYAD